MELVKDSQGRKYYKVNGTCYSEGTPYDVINILESARFNRDRIRVFYGDSKTGRDWMEEYNVTGTVGRSTGEIKIPLMIHNSCSMGGPSILTDCIVKLVVNGRMRYFHPKYTVPKITVKDKSCYNKNGNLITKFKTKEQAERWKEFIQGHRLCK